MLHRYHILYTGFIPHTYTMFQTNLLGLIWSVHRYQRKDWQEMFPYKALKSLLQMTEKHSSFYLLQILGRSNVQRRLVTDYERMCVLKQIKPFPVCVGINMIAQV